MPLYEYKALDSKGRQVKGTIDSENPRTARVKLRSTGVFPMEIVREEGGLRGEETGERLLSLRWRRIPSKDLAITTRQLSTLLAAGLPIVNSLDTLIQQIRNPVLRKVLTRVREEVTEGQPFSRALGRFPRIFPNLYIHMVRSGELSGSLDVILLRLADLLEGQVRLRNRIRSMLAYPLFMLVVSLGVLLFLITYVIPIVTRLFQEAHQALPLPTLILITVSDLLRHYGWVLIPFAVFSILLYKRLLRTTKGRERIDRIKLRIPYLGAILQKLLIARFTRGLGTLLQGGIPLAEALETVKAMIVNVPIASAIEASIQGIRAGEGLAPPLERSGRFPPMVIQMIASGEKSGALEGMLFKAAEANEEEVETSLNAVTSLFEPLLILVLGLIVGFIVLSVLLPILRMSQLIR